MGHAEHRHRLVENVGYFLVTVSDSRAEADDVSGRTMVDLVAGSGGRVVAKVIVRNDSDALLRAARDALALPEVDSLVCSGGTGASKRDVTVETLRPLFDKELVGFGEVFRALSMVDIGSAAVLSRATAGVAGGKAIFLLPGSTEAVRLALEEIILPQCGHILWEARR